MEHQGRFAPLLTGLAEERDDRFCVKRSITLWRSVCGERSCPAATSPSDKAFYIEREQNWLLLARSYELHERTALFAKELPRPGRHRSGPAPSCPSCMTPTRICWFHTGLHRLWVRC